MAPKKEPDAALRPVVRLALRAWYGGTDMATALPRRTVYKFRREILDATGIDILLPHRDQDKGAKVALLGLAELRAREVRDVPERIQRSLFGAGV